MLKKLVLRTNGFVALSSGLALTFWPDVCASLLGTPSDLMGLNSALLLQIIGALTLTYALHVACSSLRPVVPKWELGYFAVCDAAWVATTIALFVAGAIRDDLGAIVALGFAVFVGACGVYYAANIRQSQSVSA